MNEEENPIAPLANLDVVNPEAVVPKDPAAVARGRKGGRPKGSKNRVTRGRARKKVLTIKPTTGEAELTNTPREPRRRRKQNIGEPKTYLGAPPIEGHVTRWVNDYEGRDRLSEFYGNDWEFVLNREIESFHRIEVGDESVTPQLGLGEKVRRKVGTEASGRVLYAYLMKKRKEYYDSDMAEKLEAGPGETEKSLKRGQTGVNVEHQHGEINLTRET